MLPSEPVEPRDPDIPAHHYGVLVRAIANQDPDEMRVAAALTGAGRGR